MKRKNNNMIFIEKVDSELEGLEVNDDSISEDFHDEEHE
jgi:hypothetical protein